MDRREIQGREMVERYLQGQLRAEDERAFEEAYLSDPGLLDELVLTEKLQQGLRQEARSAELRAETARAAAPAQPRWRRAFGSVPYAAAATLLLGISVALSTLLLVQNRSLQTGAHTASAPVQLVPLVSVRGDGANRVVAPSAGEWAVLLVDAGFGDYDDYRATLTREAEGAAEEVTALEELSPTYDGRIGLGVPGSALTPGDYELVLEGRRAGQGFEQVTRIPVTVTASR